MVLMNIEDTLADLGSDAVSSAATVDRALTLLDAERFDLAILDVNLDGQTSYLVADALASRSIPFVFSTGYGPRGVESRFKDRPVLTKPYCDKELVSALASLLTPVPVDPT